MLPIRATTPWTNSFVPLMIDGTSQTYAYVSIISRALYLDDIVTTRSFQMGSIRFQRTCIVKDGVGVGTHVGMVGLTSPVVVSKK